MASATQLSSAMWQRPCTSVIPGSIKPTRKAQPDCALCARAQESLEGMGMDAALAVARARSRSRVGRKRERSLGPSAMDIDGAAAGDGDVIMAPPKKRIHSSKSR